MASSRRFPLEVPGAGRELRRIQQKLSTLINLSELPSNEIFWRGGSEGQPRAVVFYSDDSEWNKVYSSRPVGVREFKIILELVESQIFTIEETLRNKPTKRGCKSAHKPH